MTVSPLARAWPYMQQVLGDPYVSGGAAPGGFDCSGLVCWLGSQVSGSPWTRRSAQGLLERYYSPVDPAVLVLTSRVGIADLGWVQAPDAFGLLWKGDPVRGATHVAWWFNDRWGVAGLGLWCVFEASSSAGVVLRGSWVHDGPLVIWRAPMGAREDG